MIMIIIARLATKLILMYYQYDVSFFTVNWKPVKFKVIEAVERARLPIHVIDPQHVDKVTQYLRLDIMSMILFLFKNAYHCGNFQHKISL